MKLTKLQRYTAYCILLEEAECKITNSDFSHGLCRLYWDLSPEDSPRVREDLPELNKVLSVVNTEYDDYFVGTIFNNDESGWAKRIAALKQCIVETAPK